jgi:hypothetical protein
VRLGAPWRAGRLEVKAVGADGVREVLDVFAHQALVM